MIGKKYTLAAVLACTTFAAQAAETIYTFDTVTGIQHRQNDVVIRGTLVSDATPTSVTLPWSQITYPYTQYTRCADVFNVVLSNPAAFTLTVTTELVTEQSPLGGTTTTLYFRSCSADRKP